MDNGHDHVELHEALKEPVGEKAAQLIAEVFPAARDLATKNDLGVLRTEMGELRTDLKVGLLSLRHALTEQGLELKLEMRSRETRLLRWMIVLMVPLYAGIFGLVTTLLWKA